MTGLTPNMMMLGREINMPADLVFRPPGQENTDEEEYVRNLKKAMLQAHEIARQKLKSSHAYMKRDYDIRIRKVEYKPGDLVYTLNMAHTKGRSKKLDSPWKGPGVVLKRITAYVYQVQLEKSVIIINHDRMKKCEDREMPKWAKRKRQQILDGGIESQEESEEFCICRKGDNGSFMVQCDGCDDWYHGDCVGVSPEEADLLKEYYCPRCQTKL